MATAAGWFNDPYGRFELRYWDGNAWTEHVSTQGTQTVDPLGVTTVIPIVTPASAFEAPTAPPFAASTGASTLAAPSGGGSSGGGSSGGGSSGGGSSGGGSSGGGSSGGGSSGVGTTVRRFLDGLGPDAKVRPVPRLSIALAGVGGAFLAAGVTVAVVGDSVSRGAAIGAGIVVVALGVVCRLMVKAQLDVRAAAVGAGVVGLFVLGAGLVFDDLGDAWGTFVVAAMFLAAWLLPGFRGRPIMLGIGALLAVIALAIATGSDGSEEVFGLPSDIIGDQEVVFLLAAGVLLWLVWWLDRAGYSGVGTSLVVAALVSAFIGVGQATSNIEDTLAALLITAVGLAVCFVGSCGDRRASTWWGAVLTSIGVCGLFVSLLEPTSSSSAAAVLFLTAATLIVGIVIGRSIQASRARDAAGSLPTPTP